MGPHDDECLMWSADRDMDSHNALCCSVQVRSLLMKVIVSYPLSELSPHTFADGRHVSTSMAHGVQHVCGAREAGVGNVPAATQPSWATCLEPS